jgi:outer membrane protein assembly factor BamB
MAKPANVSDRPVGDDPVKPGRLFPPKTVLAACVVFVLLAIWMQNPDAFGGALAEGFFRAAKIFDHQLANILTLIFAFLAFVILLAWFVFFSAYGRKLRLGALVAFVGAIVLAAVSLRVAEVSGELIPRFEWRWKKRPDQTLAAPDASPAPGVDLGSTTPDDFPGFLGPHRSAYLPKPTLAREWPAEGFRPLWRQPIGAGWAGFAVVNGYAVTLEQRGDQEFVTCYDVASGELKWSHAHAGRHEHPLGGVGPRSTPTIDEGRIYAITATGALVVLSGADGSVVWEKDLVKEVDSTPEKEASAILWGRAGSPLVVDNLVVVPGGGPGPNAVSLLAFDKQTGELRWRGGSRQISYASPSLNTLAGIRQILIVNEDTVAGHAIDSGKELWSFPFAGHSNSDASASQAVAVDHDRVFVSKGYYGGATIYKILKNDAGKWSAEPVWQDARKMKTKFTNVVVRDGFIHGLSDGILECLAIDDGHRRWKKGRYGHGQILGVGDLLLVLAESGELVLCELNPEKQVELARFQAIEGKTWNTFALYGRRVLVRNGEEAACYELP